MTTLTPDYYKDFKCTSKSCKHNCCIGWEIDIDDQTLEKYNSVKGSFGYKLQQYIELTDTVHFKLDKNERCPFLNNENMCEIIIDLGENMLCQICSDHPRFRNFFSEHTEIGLGLCCEAAAKLIITKKEKTGFICTNGPCYNTDPKQTAILKVRKNIFDILQDRDMTVNDRVTAMLDHINAPKPFKKDWYTVFCSLEKLDAAWDKYLLKIKNGIDITTQDNSLDTAYEQLLVYLIFRHLSDAQYDGMLKERVSFTALIYYIIKTMNRSNTEQELIEIARLFSCEIEYSDENIKVLLAKIKNE